MRYLVLSDLHANRHALEAVLEAAQADCCDRVLVLGDLVGYGADPNGVIERVRSLAPLAVIRGNHDRVACGLASADEFNTVARTAALWTMGALSPESREYLRVLPMGPLRIASGLEICHGAPFDEDAYVFDADDAIDALDAAQQAVCLFGHTHLPVVFSRSARGLAMVVPDADETTVELQPETRYLVNPGSVGQPRDGDPRAAFAVLDDEARRLVLRRVTYPVELAQEAVRDARLPASLANRLALGR